MKCYHDLYLSEDVVSKKDEILNKIEQNQWQVGKYVIALTKNEQNHLEIFDSVLLIQKVLPKEELFVVGIAGSYGGAIDLVKQITEEVYAKTTGVDIRNYLLKSQQEYEGYIC